MSTSDLTAILSRAPVIPVLTIESVHVAVPLARALVEGGLPVIEVTLRTQVALEAIAAVAAEVPDCVVGAGTVLQQADIDAAINVGAKFLVSPGTPLSLADAFSQCSVPVLPGCATVSEAMMLAERGFPILKFFPAEPSGGVRWLKSVAAPMPRLRFCPTGGIDMSNARDYLDLPNVIAIGGSWVAPKELVTARDFSRIAALARAAADIRN